MTKSTHNFRPALCPALCLDLDAIVSNRRFIDKLEATIHAYRNKSFLIIGVLNQGGVAHGEITPQQATDKLKAVVALFDDNPFHLIKCCPHDQTGNTEPYNHRSLHQMPNIGMLASVESELWRGLNIIIDWNNSILVGHSTDAMQLAANANIEFIYIGDFIKAEHPITVK